MREDGAMFDTQESAAHCDLRIFLLRSRDSPLNYGSGRIQNRNSGHHHLDHLLYSSGDRIGRLLL